MRLIWLNLPLFFLWACKDNSSSSSTKQKEPEPKVSYSKDIRPLLIENCLSCHADLPLHNLEGWNLLHQHEEEVEIPALLQKWVMEGSEIDPHWAGLPLRNVAGNSVDDFVETSPELETAREVPKAMFTASIPDLLAGDLMEDQARSISTGYLRRGEDSPEWRAEMVAQEFLGMNIACARCHDHPTEHWTTERYAKLAELFTTPYDHLPKALPPLFVKVSDEASQKIASLEEELKAASEATPVADQDYLDWLALDEEAPTLPGLVAAFSFEGQGLANLAFQSVVKADGNNLISEASAHGEGLLFEENSELVLSDLPIESELDRFTISAWIKMGADSLSDTPIVTIGTRERGFEFRVTDAKLQARWTRFWPQVAASVTSKFPAIAPDRWSHVAITYDGTRQASGFQIYLNGLPIEIIEAPSKLMKSVLAQKLPLIFAGKGLSLDEVQIYNDALTPIGIRQIFDGRSLLKAYQNSDDLREFYQRHLDKNEASRRQQVRLLNEALLQSENDLPAYLVMAANPKQEITEGSDEPADRLEFSKRLNPDLLARSLANEVWRRHFGEPLTPSLGLSAPLPAHGDLLEWLAGKLKKSDFNVTLLGELIRESKAWGQEWTAPEFEPASCPRPEE